MKNIFAILKDLGIEVPADKESALNSAMNENYRTIVDYNNQKVKLDDALKDASDKDATINDLNDKLKDADKDSDTIKDLQKTIDDYKQAEDDRKKADEEAAKKRDFEPKFAEALGERKFTNGIIEESVKAKAFKLSSENPNMTVASIIETLTKDAEGVFTNPNKPDPNPLPKPNGGEGGKLDIRTREDIANLTEAQINENWEQVSKILSN